ncbi:MAG: DUF2065 family protein [Gammaproteobacteria bacterium]|nr:DUF2065 family protein [Gammaproteobacteria bacterium]
MAWNDLLVAFSLYLVLEGVFPFLSPYKFRKHLEKMSKMPDQSLRQAGLVLMVCGVVVLYLIR